MTPPPPKNHVWLVNAEKRSSTLYLLKEENGEEIQIHIPSSEIDRLIMTWKESTTIEGWGDRISFILLKSNGDEIDFGRWGLWGDYEIDDSFLSNKEHISQKHLYIVGNTSENGNPVKYKLCLGYSNFAQFKKDKSKIPTEITFFKDK